MYEQLETESTAQENGRDKMKSIKVKGIQTLRVNDKCLMRILSLKVKYTSTGFGEET